MNFTNTNYNLKDETRQQVIFLVILSCVSLICQYIRIVLFNISAERQARTIRQMLFESIMKKDIVYFDNHKTGELNSLLTDEVDKIRDGIGDKLSFIIEMMANVIATVVIGRLLFFICSVY